MDNFNYQKWVKENKESSLDEMAKIVGDLKTSIENVINDNPDVEGAALKRLIKNNPNVINALGDEKLHDNQLNITISNTRGGNNQPPANPTPARQNQPRQNIIQQNVSQCNNLTQEQNNLLRNKQFRNS